MPSNNELRGQAIELAEELGITITAEGLNNQKLAELVSDLKAKLRDKANVTQADAIDTTNESADTHGLRVAPGKSITTKRGIKVEGDEIIESDISNFENLAHLVDSGYIEEY